MSIQENMSKELPIPELQLPRLYVLFDFMIWVAIIYLVLLGIIDRNLGPFIVVVGLLLFFQMRWTDQMQSLFASKHCSRVIGDTINSLLYLEDSITADTFARHVDTQRQYRYDVVGSLITSTLFAYYAERGQLYDSKYVYMYPNYLITSLRKLMLFVSTMPEGELVDDSYKRDRFIVLYDACIKAARLYYYSISSISVDDTSSSDE